MMGVIAEEFRQIACYESDIFGKLLPTAAMNYFQEVSTNQGIALGIGADYLRQKHLAWFLVKYDIRFDKIPDYGSQVRITTEATGMDRYCAVRQFKITDLDHNNLIVANTQWLLINTENQKMESVENHPEFSAYDCFEKKEPIFRKLSRLKMASASKKIEVRFLDIDFNNHVNHVKYLAWAIEALPMEIVKTRTLKQAKIVFKEQCFYGDEVEVLSELIDENIYGIEIMNQNQKLLCQLELILK
ncbi:thioesterase [Eubacteriaceae bacterium ES2]|nr:thioesterase [Eubacteriaceae bacterium ES2]